MCGAPLVNGPRYAACNSCQNTELYPRFTEAERRAAEREKLPIASRMACVETWWKLSDRPGIWEARGDKDFPCVVRARYQTAWQEKAGRWSVGYFVRAEKVENELRKVLT